MPNITDLSFSQWLRFVFDHDVRLDPNAEQWHWSEDIFVGDADTLVDLVRRLCESFAASTAPYSVQQVDQGVWFLLGPQINFGRYLADDGIDERLRVSTVRAMPRIYDEYVSKHVSLDVTSFDMWWDLIFNEFWGLVRTASGKDATFLGSHDDLLRTARALTKLNPLETREEQFRALGLPLEEAYTVRGQQLFDEAIGRDLEGSEPALTESDLSQSQREVFDAMLQSLIEILSLDHAYCVHAALHGLGHSNHPQAAAAIDQFIRDRSTDVPAELIAYALECREGKMM